MRLSSSTGLADRRRFLKFLTAGAAIAMPGWSLSAHGLWAPDVEDLSATPPQTQGPYYPEKAIEEQMFNDNDLLQKLPGHELAKGQPVIVDGTVTDRKGKPINAAIVEIWQACASGRYNHSFDSRSRSRLLDNNFQFWGRAITGEDGKYSFTTIIPGQYPGRSARHIHFRIDAPSHKRLTTQCYFSEYGDDNARDGVYQELETKERDLVTVQLDKPTDTAKPWTGAFPIVLS